MLQTRPIRSAAVVRAGALVLACLGAASAVHAQIPLHGIVGVSAGGAFSCALTSGGAVLCWGAGAGGELGDGLRTNRSSAGGVAGLSSGVLAVSAGSEHACAITAGGAARCWGLDYDGQLGDGSGAFGVIRDTPVAVVGLAGGVASIAAGASHTCAVSTGGGVKCWGRNDHGQLGDGTTMKRLAPVAVSGLSSGVAAVVPGAYHTCALMTAGGVQCWGDNEYGQLGDGSTTERLTPVAVSGLAGASAISAGDYHACALVGGGVVCWGDNGNGQLGNGSTTSSNTPVATSGLASGVVDVSAGADFDHSCALLAGGSVRCWGEYRFPIGGIFPIASTTPLDRGFSGAVAISAGGAGFVLTAHVCAIGIDGGVTCMGGNHYGQLGDGHTADWVETPVAVVLADVIFSDGYE